MQGASRQYVRADLLSEVVSSDENSHIVRVKLTPDPRRYEIFEKDGKQYWRDKFLGAVFGWEAITQMAATVPGAPLFYSAAMIGDAVEYAARRRETIRRELSEGSYEPPSEVCDPHQALPHDPTEIEATFLSVDVVNSTETRAKNTEKYDEVIDVLFREMGTAVGYFHGSVLKLTGDGFVCFLDPSVNSQFDDAIGLGLTFLRILNAVNAATSEAHPKLSVRVGAEHGQAKGKDFRVPATGYNQFEVVSDALNRAAKIQQSAPANSFVIGRALYERIHVQWLERASEIELGIDVGSDDYRTYLIR